MRSRDPRRKPGARKLGPPGWDPTASWAASIGGSGSPHVYVLSGTGTCFSFGAVRMLCTVTVGAMWIVVSEPVCLATGVSLQRSLLTSAVASLSCKGHVWPERWVPP